MAKVVMQGKDAKITRPVRSGFRRARTVTVPVRAQGKQEVLLLSTTSGNHAVLGLQAAKQLSSRGHSVTLAAASDTPETEQTAGPPVMYFEDELRSKNGVEIVYTGKDVQLDGNVPDRKFDIVLDNNSKDGATTEPVLSFAKARGAQKFVFVSSCGIYQDATATPLLESDAVKSSGQGEAEQLLFNDSSIAAVACRPQYPTGFGHVERGDTWFFDRIYHNRYIPIPGTGEQVVNVADAADLGELLALCAESSAANNRAFNCVGERGITLHGLARLACKAAGVDARNFVVHYSPEEAGVDPKQAFPYRSGAHFFAEPRNAKELLGWRQERALETTFAERWQEYKQLRDQSKIDFSLDDKLLSVAK